MRGKGLRRAASIGVLAACTSSSGGDAFDVVSAESTNLRLARSGDGYGNRYRRMRELVPEVNELTAGGSVAADRLIAAFEATPDASRDAALVVYAYALGEMNEEAALGALAGFLSRTRTGELWLAPQAATHTVLKLLGDPRLNAETYFYTLADVDYAASAAGDIGVKPATSRALRVTAAATSRVSCRRRYLLLDAAGNAISVTDVHGKVVPLSVEGTEFSDITRVSASSDWANEVKSGGGIYVPELDGGVPNRRYNCAGYAFRELNAGGGWNVDAQALFRNLVGAGLLREKSKASRGDKVFYTHDGSIAHVAEVERVEADGTIIVRNADNQSGVFDAPVDAQYFATRQYDARIYEWSPRPRVMEDPAVAGDPGYCNGQTPVGPSAGGADAGVPDAGAPDAGGSGTCPPSSGNVVGYCAGENDCPAGGGACACRSGSLFCCSTGFCYTRGIAGCQQETCPSGVGRRYNGSCKCDPPSKAVYDPCRPAILTDCIR